MKQMCYLVSLLAVLAAFPAAACPLDGAIYVAGWEEKYEMHFIEEPPPRSVVPFLATVLSPSGKELFKLRFYPPMGRGYVLADVVDGDTAFPIQVYSFVNGEAIGDLVFDAPDAFLFPMLSASLYETTRHDIEPVFLPDALWKRVTCMAGS